MPPPVGTLANPASGAVGPYATAFRALVAYLKAHPKLAPYVRSWKVWDGVNDDDVEPTASQCPWVRLTPSILPASYMGESPVTGGLNARRANTPLKIDIETAVVDTNFNDSAMCWFNFDAALFPIDQAGIAALRAVLNGAGVSDLTLIQPALPTGLASFGDGLIVGDGSVQLDIELIL